MRSFRLEPSRESFRWVNLNPKRWVDPFVPGLRRSRQSTLLWVLALSVEKQLPLGPMVRSVATESANSGWGRRVDRLADLLVDGVPLAEALERLPGLLPPGAELAIKAGADSGTLAQTLRTQAAASVENERNAIRGLVGMALYMAGLLLVILLVLWFLVVFIVPKMKAIFDDFNVRLPAVTRLTIDLTDLFVNDVFPWLLLGGVPLLIFLIVRRLGYLGGRTPLFNPVRARAPAVLRTLGDAAAAGRPLIGVVSSLARHEWNGRVNRALLTVRGTAETGRSVWQALTDAGFATLPESRVFEAAERAGNLPWALHEAASAIDRNRQHRLELRLEILRPLVLLAIGFIVGLFAIGLFLPLVTLIRDAAQVS